MEREGQLDLEILIAVLLLILYIIASPIFDKYNFHYIHESGLVMLLGIAITLIFKFYIPSIDFSKSLAFSDKIFFTFILPPIIFGAGYNLKRRKFFKYFLYIFLLGVVATIITFIWVGPITYFFNKFNFFYLSYSKYNLSTLIKMGGIPIDPLTKEKINISSIKGNNSDESINIYNNSNNYTNIKKYPILLDFSLMDALSFAAVISATDPVAALTFINEDEEPKLFAILFGEGSVNDAVCPVIYKILTDFQKSGGDFNFSSITSMFGTFCSLFGWSLIIGFGTGVIGSLILKYLKRYCIGRINETALICLFAYLSYIISQEFELSPIIALLFNGIFNSHYTFYNLSFQAREESATLSKVISAIAEAFVFIYLGLTAVHYFQIAFSWNFMIFELMVIIIGRFVAVYGICFIMDIFHVSSFKLSFTERGICCCSGTIRGAIAFGLSISIISKSELNKEILVSTTLAQVFFSTIVFGALIPYFIKFWKSFEKNEEIIKNNLIEDNKNLINHNIEISYIDSDDSINDIRFSYLHPNFDNKREDFSKEKNLKMLKKRLSYWIGKNWLEFDDDYLKPKLICNWPEVKKEHDEIAEVISNVIEEYLEEKKKKKLLLKNERKNNENNIEMNNFNLNEIDGYKTSFLHFKDN